MTIRPHLNIPAAYMLRSKQMRLIDWLESCENPDTRHALEAIYRHYLDLWPKVAASNDTHQPWPGGLRDHLADMCRMGWDDYQFYLLRLGALPFSFDDVLVAILCHDADLLVKGGSANDERCIPYLNWHHQEGLPWEEVKLKLLDAWKAAFGLPLTPAIRNAATCPHGEPDDDYRNDRRAMYELATFVGNLDRASALIFHNHGKGKG